MENGTDKGKVLPTKNPQSRLRCYLWGDEDGFGAEDGNGKTIPSPAPLPSLLKMHTDQMHLASF